MYPLAVTLLILCVASTIIGAFGSTKDISRMISIDCFAAIVAVGLSIVMGIVPSGLLIFAAVWFVFTCRILESLMFLDTNLYKYFKRRLS